MNRYWEDRNNPPPLVLPAIDGFTEQQAVFLRNVYFCHQMQAVYISRDDPDAQKALSLGYVQTVEDVGWLLTKAGWDAIRRCEGI